MSNSVLSRLVSCRTASQVAAFLVAMSSAHVAAQAEDSSSSAAAEARALREAGDLDGAARLLRGEGSAEAMFEQARLAMASQDYRAARSACATLASAHRDSPWATICDARAFLVWNRSARALTALENLSTSGSAQAEAMLATAEAHRLRGDFDEAEAAYLAALAVDDSRAEAHRGLGHLYSAAQREDEAEAALRQAIALNSADVASRLALARLVRGSEGRRTAREVTEAAPQLLDGWLLYGELSLSAEAHEEAARAFEAALELQPENGRAIRGLGLARAGQGRSDDARVLLDAAREALPGDATIVMTIGRLAEQSGDAAAAYRNYQHASALSPADPAGYLAAAELAIHQERYNLATGYLDRLFQRAPNNAAALELYGDALVQMRNVREARTYYQRARQAAADTSADVARIDAKLEAL